MTRRAGSAGFILVEALAALIVAALTIGGLASLVGVMLRAGDRIAAAADATDARARLLPTLRGEFSAAVRARLAGEGAAYAFLGRADRLIFVRRTPAGEATVAFTAIAAGGQYRLTRSEAPFVPGLADLDALVLPPPATIAVAASPFVFGYAEATDAATETVTDAWDGGTSLPAAVMLTIGDGRGGRESLRFAFGADAEPACVRQEQGFCGLGTKGDGGPPPRRTP